MKKIIFVYRDSESLNAFTPVLEQVFRFWHLESALIKYIIIAGNENSAGEDALRYFKESWCDILIVGDRITLPQEIPCVYFKNTDDMAKLFQKISKYEETFA